MHGPIWLGDSIRRSEANRLATLVVSEDIMITLSLAYFGDCSPQQTEYGCSLALDISTLFDYSHTWFLSFHSCVITVMFTPNS